MEFHVLVFLGVAFVSLLALAGALIVVFAKQTRDASIRADELARDSTRKVSEIAATANARMAALARHQAEVSQHLADSIERMARFAPAPPAVQSVPVSEYGSVISALDLGDIPDDEARKYSIREHGPGIQVPDIDAPEGTGT